MNTSLFRVSPTVLAAVVLLLACSPGEAVAQARKKNPASKVYVSDVAGEAQIDTGDSVEDLNRRSVYTAQGAVIDTKRPAEGEDRSKCYSTMVYSNGTGAFFDADTRVEIRRFVQEPFVPTRADNEVEPSISQTQAYVSRGTVGLCASKLVAGSTMQYSTPHATVNVRGRKIVIQTDADSTRITMIEGESTVRAGDQDMGGHNVRAGQQAVIRRGPPGQPNAIEIVKLPPGEATQLDDKVAMACMAKRTVYFDVRGRRSNSDEDSVFDNDPATPRSAGDPFTTPEGEIVAIPVVPATLPVQFTVSPATLTTPGTVVTPGNGTPTPGQGGPPGG